MNSPIRDNALKLFTCIENFQANLSSAFIHFPIKGKSLIQIKNKMKKYRSKFLLNKNFYDLGKPRNFPIKAAISAWKYFIQFNPNNIGDTGENSNKSLFGTRKIEKEVITIMTELYKGRQREVTGYITSGATESLLFAFWASRQYMIGSKKQSNSLFLLKTRLTHIAVDKNAEILCIPTYDVPLGENYTMSPSALSASLEYLYNGRKIRNFILLATTGYTSTGGVDNIQELGKVYRRFLYKNNCRGMFIIDAAFGGLTLPFVSDTQNFLDFSLFDAIAIDFHKMGGVPLPCGLILYKKILRPFVEKKIPYIGINHATVSGSRPGTSAVAAWSAIMNLGWIGYSRRIKHCLSLKNYFIDKLTSIDCKIDIITNEHINIFAFVPQKHLLRKINDTFKKKYGLSLISEKIKFVGGTTKTISFFQIYVMPYATKKLIDEFLNEYKEMVAT